MSSYSAEYIGDAGSGDSGNREGRPDFTTDQRTREDGELPGHVIRCESINLVQRHDPRFGFDALAVGSKLPDDSPAVRRNVIGRAIDEMKKDRTPFHMAQEPISNTPTLVRTLDQTGDIGDDKLLSVDFSHSQIRVRGRKRKVGDPGPGIGCCGKECRLAGIRKPDKPNIGNHLQSKPHRPFDARLSGIGATGRLICCRLEMEIAESTVAANSQPHPVVTVPEIGNDCPSVFLKDFRSLWHLQFDRPAMPSGARAA